MKPQTWMKSHKETVHKEKRGGDLRNIYKWIRETQ